MKVRHAPSCRCWTCRPAVVGERVRIALYGSFQHVMGYVYGDILAIGATITGHSPRQIPAAIVAWDSSEVGGHRDAVVEPCPLFRLEAVR